jgi:hypothetical protein
MSGKLGSVRDRREVEHISIGVGGTWGTSLGGQGSCRGVGDKEGGRRYVWGRVHERTKGDRPRRTEEPFHDMLSQQQ